MTADQFGHVHASGRFDVTEAEFTAALADFRATRGVKLVTGTEAHSFASLLAANGWDHFIGNGECYVAWAVDTFEPAWKGAGHADRIGSTFFRGGNKDARTPLTTMPLRHLPSGLVIRVRVPHTPAHVQDGDGFRKTTARVIQQAAAWSSALAVMGKMSRRSRRHNPKSAEVVAGDFNVDLHRAHWRGVIGRALGLECATPIPRGGDLGKRLVSWFFYRGLRVASASVMEAVEGFDHKPVRVVWSIKE